MKISYNKAFGERDSISNGKKCKWINLKKINKKFKKRKNSLIYKIRNLDLKTTI